MSFLPPEEQNQNGPSGQTTANPGMGGTNMPPPASGGSTGAGSSAPKAGAAPSSGTPTQFGSSSSKLGDYLSANAPQITQQANTIAGQLGNQYQQVGTDITNAANQFGQTVQGGYTAGNQDLVNQAAANPTSFVTSDPNNVSQFQSQLNDTYTGPQNYESTTPYSNIQNEVTNAVQGAQGLGTQTGLEQYFSQADQNPTQASNTLNSLLIQGNPEAQQTVQNAAGQYANLTPQFQQSVTNSDALVPAAQQAAQNAAQYAQSQIGNTSTGFGNTLNTGLTQAEQQRDAYNQAVNQFGTQAGDLRTQVNNYLAGLPGQPTITDYAGQAVAGANPITNPISLANYATPAQYQEASALQQLLGQGYTSPLNQANSAQAGTAPTIGQAPTMKDLADQYANPLYSKWYNAATDPATYGTGNRSDQNIEAQSEALAKYLSQYDPAGYTNPQGGGYFFQ